MSFSVELKGFDELEKATKRLKKVLREDVKNEVVNLANRVSQETMIRTKFWSGSSLFNWHFTFDSPDESPAIMLEPPSKNHKPNYDKIAGEAFQRNLNFLNTWAGQDEIWLTNNVPYIRQIEFGFGNHSGSPAHMLEMGYQLGRVLVEEAIKNIELKAKSAWL